MEYVEGRIVTHPSLRGIYSAAERTAAYQHVVDILARLHSIDIATYMREDDGSDNFVNNRDTPKQTLKHQHRKGSAKRSRNFVERQLDHLYTISKQQGKRIQETEEDLPHQSTLQTKSVTHVMMEIRPVLEALKRYAPFCRGAADRPRLIYGDYKIDNIVFHPTFRQVVAILDWALGTVYGDRFCDLANIALTRKCDQKRLLDSSKQVRAHQEIILQSSNHARTGMGSETLVRPPSKSVRTKQSCRKPCAQPDKIVTASAFD
jgi:aminoglycoside phosphotransferase (APT) family kinase protein